MQIVSCDALLLTAVSTSYANHVSASRMHWVYTPVESTLEFSQEFRVLWPSAEMVPRSFSFIIFYLTSQCQPCCESVCTGNGMDRFTYRLYLCAWRLAVDNVKAFALSVPTRRWHVLQLVSTTKCLHQFALPKVTPAVMETSFTSVPFQLQE